MIDLTGKVAIVTGGSRGIGRAIVLRLAQQGADIAFMDRGSPEVAAQTRAEAVRPEEIRIRVPVDWDSVDPIPPQLAAVLASPGPVDVPLDDVVPGDPPTRAIAPTPTSATVPGSTPTEVPA